MQLFRSQVKEFYLRDMVGANSLYTVQSNYNFTHVLYLTCGAHVFVPRVFQRGQREIITHVPTNSHACKTHVIHT